MQTMNIFITGASGYIGGSVAEKLRASGHQIFGLARDDQKAKQLQERGINPVLGTLDDATVLTEAAKRSDAVINAASSDHRGAVETLIAALVGSGKTLIHTSGSSIVGDKALGEFSPTICDEDTRPEPEPEKVARVAIDQLVLDSSRDGVRSVVICPSLIYGPGRGLHAESVQLPPLIREARQSGVARHIGRGLNIWSHVHIDDVADLYSLALERAPTGSFFFAEHGEASFKEIAEAISRGLGLGGQAESWPIDAAIAVCGYELAVFALASNSRVRGVKARQVLDWQPHGTPLLEEIERTLKTQSTAA
jgi:nucleoside-diphosphate-sugar epimerase